jgi:putative restriction endonuclease
VSVGAFDSRISNNASVSYPSQVELETRRFWWVNQNQTHREEIAGGFLWSPKRNANGARNHFYDNMCDVEPGDIVFSFFGTRIQAIGVASARAETVPKPAFRPTGQSNNWSEEGWLVGVEYTMLAAPIRPKDHVDLIRPLLPGKYSPLQQNGDGLQSVYLAEISEELANLLVNLVGTQLPTTPPVTDPDPPWEITSEEEEQLAALRGRTDIGEVERTQLVKARRGQGLFRTNVRMNESRCRVTGITEPAHLRASHIKPWKDSTDEEKVHGCNGMLLAPHVDHLFDRGWISFTGAGDLIVSNDLSPHVLEAWDISQRLNVGPFNELQAGFLEYHRSHVFRTGTIPSHS